MRHAHGASLPSSSSPPSARAALLVPGLGRAGLLPLQRIAFRPPPPPTHPAARMHSKPRCHLLRSPRWLARPGQSLTAPRRRALETLLLPPPRRFASLPGSLLPCPPPHHEEIAQLMVGNVAAPALIAVHEQIREHVRVDVAVGQTVRRGDVAHRAGELRVVEATAAGLRAAEATEELVEGVCHLVAEGCLARVPTAVDLAQCVGKVVHLPLDVRQVAHWRLGLRLRLHRRLSLPEARRLSVGACGGRLAASCAESNRVQRGLRRPLLCLSRQRRGPLGLQRRLSLPVPNAKCLSGLSRRPVGEGDSHPISLWHPQGSQQTQAQGTRNVKGAEGEMAKAVEGMARTRACVASPAAAPAAGSSPSP